MMEITTSNSIRVKPCLLSIRFIVWLSFPKKAQRLATPIRPETAPLLLVHSTVNGWLLLLKQNALHALPR